MEARSDEAGRVAVVTGGSAGIGLGICIAFAKIGCKVAFTGRSAERGEKALQIIKQEAGCDLDVLLFIQGDVSVEENVVEMFEKVVAMFGRLDFLINNAGIGETGFLLGTGSELFDKVMKINAYGVFYCMKHGIKQMKSQDPLEKGVYAVVNISSIAGIMPISHAFAYTVAKHAVTGMTRAAAKEAAGFGIKVNSILPGLIDTDMAADLDEATLQKIFESQVIGRKGTASEIADAVLFACTTPFMMGHQLVMDGGNTCY